MTNLLRDIVKDERGQDTIECALFVGIVVLAGVAMFGGHGSSLKGMWATSLERLADFRTSAG